MTPYYEDADSGIVIYHGDCREVLPHVGEVDLVLTDPPYGTTNNRWDKSVNYWQSVPLNVAHVVFSSQPFTSILICGNLKKFRYDLIWIKSHPTGHLNASKQPLRQHETICVFGTPDYVPALDRKHEADVRPFGRGARTDSYNEFDVSSPRLVDSRLSYPTSTLEFNSPNHGEAGLHPTQKPITLMGYLLRLYPAETTLDPFLGSGTTLVAAKKLSRRAIGIEIEERYCEIAARRLDATPRSLFAELPPEPEQHTLF